MTPFALRPGLPVGDVPATPAGPMVASGKDGVSEDTLLAIATELGEPVGYIQEHGGGLVQNLVPERRNEGRQSSTSSSVRLAWHTETAFHPHKPRYLLLLCLRGDPEARTLLCAIDDVLPHLSDTDVAVLREPRFRTRPDESFLEPGAVGQLGEPLAVLNGDEFTYDEDLMVGMDEDAHGVLARLGAAVHAHATALTLEAGDLLIVDNHRVVHGRSSFHARYDGTDRWLQRTFVVEHLPPPAERDGHIITTRF
ncbi:MAG TPA: TauD/TfdA family dioxygenase [Acidimicrobiia bacterium]|nr:TauD/TfdA family dioxygenase [Acidimicrobiia bacterium]